MGFLKENHRKPSLYVPEERNLRSWWKNAKKRMNAGDLKPKRVVLFEKLLLLVEEYRHINQWK